MHDRAIAENRAPKAESFAVAERGHIAHVRDRHGQGPAPIQTFDLSDDVVVLEDKALTCSFFELLDGIPGILPVTAVFVHTAENIRREHIQGRSLRNSS